MLIGIDESGSFTNKGTRPNSWCIVAGYASPKTTKTKYAKILTQLKLKEGRSHNEEIKLKNISESNYFEFLAKMAKLNGALIAVATDSYLNQNPLVEAHKIRLSETILKNLERMRYPEGKNLVLDLSNQIRLMPCNLYAQLQCQLLLFWSVITKGIEYFVQRHPSTLSSFQWRIDQKDPRLITAYENTFEDITPALLQTFSIEKPASYLDWCNYGFMKRFIYEKGNIPGYLTNVAPELKDHRVFNLGKIIYDDLKFCDSKLFHEIQIADLLASGLRRLLKGKFENNKIAAQLLGSLMIQAPKSGSPIKLVTFGGETTVERSTAMRIRISIKHARPMIKR